MPNYDYRTMSVQTDDDGNETFPWATAETVPSNFPDNLAAPVRIAYADKALVDGQDLTEKRINLYYDVNRWDFERPPDYVDSHWHVYNFPYVYLVAHNYDDPDVEHIYEGDIYDFAITIDGWGYTDNADVLGLIGSHLQEMVNAARMEIGSPIIPTDYTPRHYQKNIALRGGEIVYWNHVCYYVRYDMTAERNTVSPTEDTYRTRFRDFNGGPMALPDIDDIVITREHQEQQDISSRQVYIDHSHKDIYVPPGDDVTTTRLQQIATAVGNRLFYFDRVLPDGDNRIVRTIAQAVYKYDWVVPGSDPEVTGQRVRYDIMWQQGEPQAGDTFTIAFPVAESN